MTTDLPILLAICIARVVLPVPDVPLKWTGKPALIYKSALLVIFLMYLVSTKSCIGVGSSTVDISLIIPVYLFLYPCFFLFLQVSLLQALFSFSLTWFLKVSARSKTSPPFGHGIPVIAHELLCVFHPVLFEFPLLLLLYLPSLL